MRFGTWRGVVPRLAFALATAMAIGLVATAPARAGSFFPSYPHTIPRVVDAVDVNTGGPYFAPPVPYGHYAKDCLGTIAGYLGAVHGCLSGLLHSCCPGCHGSGCNLCGGTGKCGHCAKCCGDGAGNGNGCGDGDPGAGCGSGFCHNGDNACGDDGHCGGLGGWRHILHGSGQGLGACHGLGHGHTNDWVTPGFGCGNGGKAGHASTVCASLQASAPAPIVSAQCPAVMASGQSACTQSGCKLKMRHFHRMGKGCNACGGNGCGFCQGNGMASGSLCDACGGRGTGCGLCGGLGLLHHGQGVPCSACGGKGCGLCGGTGLLHGKGNLCSACGGKGCGLCGGTGFCKGLCSKLLGVPAGLVGKLFHAGEIEYFVGPGGPVPLTPGYVPYVVTTRSPRDYFAFPPFSDLDP
jgi:hypothetical protein